MAKEAMHTLNSHRQNTNSTVSKFKMRAMMAEEEDPDTIVQNVGVSQRVHDELHSQALQAFKEFHLLFCHHQGFSRTCRDRGVCKVLHCRKH